MNKTLLIAQREFLSRVRKKTFLLTTIGLPVLIFLLYATIIFFMVKPTGKLTVAIADKANIFKGAISSDNNELEYRFVNDENEAVLKEQLLSKKLDAYVWVPSVTNVIEAKGLKVICGKAVGMMTQEKVKGDINASLKKMRLIQYNLSAAQMDSVQRKSDVAFTSLDAEGEKADVAVFSYIVGYVAGFLIYIVLFIYGAMVMRGVMEEKISRIAEVMVSSVKPFQLMMGKIVGIGAVGLLQFLIWLILVLGSQFLLPLIFPTLSTQMMEMSGGGQATQNVQVLSGLMTGLSQINIPLIIVCFIFYFLGGYFLYASLFAAVGSAVNEDIQDAQSMMFPIMMPIIFAFVIMTKAVNDPTSGLAVFGSLFPFTSPIVMMARLPYGVPVWQLLTSMALLIIGFLFTTWFASRIYRTGILMYGKKAGWKELLKWSIK